MEETEVLRLQLKSREFRDGHKVQSSRAAHLVSQRAGDLPVTDEE